MADHLSNKLKVVIEDVLVKVDKFIFLIDSIMLDIEEEIYSYYVGLTIPYHLNNIDICL